MRAGCATLVDEDGLRDQSVRTQPVDISDWGYLLK